MTQTKTSTSPAILIRLAQLLQQGGLVADPDPQRCLAGLTIHPLSGDGSSRRFWRVLDQGRSLCLAVAPAGSSIPDLAEARAARAIGSHLHGRGLAIPDQYGFDSETGLLLFEDLGDCKLHDLVAGGQGADGRLDCDRMRPLYCRALESLAALQVEGAKGFDPNWCWDTPRYDRQLMQERESGYFYRAFWKDLLGQGEVAGLTEEFAAIAHEAACLDSSFFLHRDCQSRNIMVQGERLMFIDFQGGRLGPLGYDPASLLIDPYVHLPQAFQDELLEHYLDCLGRLLPLDRQGFCHGYSLLALQRNLQILGAFAFLSRVRGKRFFAAFLRPAAELLVRRLADPPLRTYQTLRNVADQALHLLTVS